MTKEHTNFSSFITFASWEYAINTLLLIGPTFGIFWAPETYFFASESYTLGAPSNDAYSGVTFAKMALYGELAWLGFHYVLRYQILVPVLMQQKVILCFALVATLSSLQTDDPSLSFNRVFRLDLLILFAVYLVERYERAKLLRLFFMCTLYGIIGSVIAVIFFPSLGYSKLTGYADAFRGAFAHKNALGSAMSWTVLIAYFALSSRAVDKRIATATAAVALVLLVMSRSATSAVATASIFGLLPFLNAIKAARRPEDKALALLAVLAIMIAVAFAGVFADDLLILLGRSPTLTGRTEVWSLVWSHLNVDATLGHGFGFWNVDSPLRRNIWGQLVWAAPHAHSNFLDLWFQTGLVGVTVAVVAILHILVRGIGRLMGSEPSTFDLFAIAITLDVLVRGLSETILADPNPSGWFALTIANAVLAQHSSERRNLGRIHKPMVEGRLPI